MTSSNKAAWLAIQSHLAAMGYAAQTVIGEPRTGVQHGMVAIIPQGGNIDETVLDKPREIHQVILRMYAGWLEEPQEDTEFLLDQFRTDILEDVFGDFELGGTIAYALPIECSWSYDVLTVENITFRTVDVTVVYRIDETAAFVP